MPLRNLFKGQATGAPLFFAWCVGAFSAFLLTFGIFQVFQKNFYLIWLGFLGSLLLLTIWESILLVPIWWRRILWAATFLVFAYKIYFAMTMLHYAFMAQIAQGVLLIGVRKRVWLWFALAIIANPVVTGFEDFAQRTYNTFVSAVAAFVSSAYIMPLFVMFAFSVQIAFGALAAFLMPPLEKSSPAAT